MTDSPPPAPDDSDWLPPPPPPTGPPARPAPLEKGWATLGTGARVRLAGPRARFKARALDSAVMWVGSLILLLIISGLSPSGSLANPSLEDRLLLVKLFVVAVLVFAAVSLIYEVTMTALFGQTLGKAVAGIEVIRSDTGHGPGWGKSILRWLPIYVLGIVPLIGWILLMFIYTSSMSDDDYQGLHDKAARTLVIEA